MAKRVVPEAAAGGAGPPGRGRSSPSELIVETALRMLREHGSAGLTARRLGLALGADPARSTATSAAWTT